MDTQLNELLHTYTRKRLEDMQDWELDNPYMDAGELAQDIIFKGRYEIPEEDVGELIELCEQWLDDNLTELAREEVRARFQITDLRETDEATN